MAKQYQNRDDGWRISDEMWNAMEPLLPPPKPTSLYTSPARRTEGKCALDRGLRADRGDGGAVARHAAGVCGRPRGRHARGSQRADRLVPRAGKSKCCSTCSRTPAASRRCNWAR